MARLAGQGPAHQRCVGGYGFGGGSTCGAGEHREASKLY